VPGPRAVTTSQRAVPLPSSEELGKSHSEQIEGIERRMKKGTLIVFSGLDGAGKSTQIEILLERLRREGRARSPVLRAFRLPAGAPAARGPSSRSRWARQRLWPRMAQEHNRAPDSGFCGDSAAWR
jgi:ATPase subunit of ABC transporter with duplicated ATPase domains